MKRRSRQPTVRPTYAPAAELAAEIAPAVLRAVVHDRRRLAPAMADPMRAAEKVRNVKDRAGIARSLRALLRWWGWIETLHLRRPEEQLLLASLLEFPELSAFGRVWAERIGRPVDQLVPVGDAPNWTARAEGLKRWIGGHAVNADPWRLFPAWIRDQLPVPPGDATPKQRRLDFLAALQSRCPTWIAVRGGDPRAIWNELREAELKPWIHRRLADAAKLPPEADLSRLSSFEAGRLVTQDLASQAFGIACDPDPGERWWDVRGEADGGFAALHLAALMGGKGSVTCTFGSEPDRHKAALRLRRGAFHNITTKVREGNHPVGKAASFDGVLVDAPSSGVGNWRRHPDARWAVAADRIPQLAADQVRLLDVASTRVRPGGSLVYTVPTLTRAETTGVIDAFLQSHPDHQLQPFPHPLEETTTGGTLFIWPHLHDCDGRFIARMIRSRPTRERPRSAGTVGREEAREARAEA
jgi:16S rRNA (cytosine967-C5)-methyltransferase